MYYNLTSIHTVLRAAPFGEQLAGAFNQFVGAEEIAPEDTGRPDWRGWRLVQALELARIGAAVTWQYLFLTRRVEAFERTADAYARSTDPAALPHLGRTALRDRLRGFMEIRRHRWKNASLADAGSMVCYGALKALLRRLLPGEEQDALHNTLLKALPGLVSSMPAIELWKLSRLICADADLAALFATAEPDAVVSAIRTTPAFAPFARAFDAYLDDWGFRCSAELMLTSPSFQENPAALVSILKSYAERDGESPEALLARQQAERLADTARVLGDGRLAEVDRPARAPGLDAALDPVARARAAQAGAPLQPSAPRGARHRRRPLRRGTSRAPRRCVHADVRRARHAARRHGDVSAITSRTKFVGGSGRTPISRRCARPTRSRSPKATISSRPKPAARRCPRRGRR